MKRLMMMILLFCLGSTLLAAEQSNALKTEVFADLGGNLHGIVFDSHGNLLVAKDGKEIYQISPDGKVSLFSIVNFPEGRPYIYDMKLGDDNQVYAAARDRVIKIAPDGRMSTLFIDVFPGQWGALAITLDQNGNIYIGHGDKVSLITPSLTKITLIDGIVGEFTLINIGGLEFNTTGNYLYLSDYGGGKLLKIYFKEKGQLGEVKLMAHATNMAFLSKRQDELWVSLDNTGKLLYKRGEDLIKIFSCENMTDNTTIARGIGKYGTDVLYATGWNTGKVYKIRSGFVEPK